ncbi:stage II sporulation protein R [Paenibacillus sp. TRM 82003]|nr:stage II sporulation protein R [Paenibacillus sp. TRM 82003]MCI3923490.1 stage II sporulation protein R [Paenibacillus sp. TRM 82003]
MKSFVLILSMLFMLVMSWEQTKADAVLAQGGTSIPQESIRLRILADSDVAADQALKRRIRDAIIEKMNGWVTGPQTIEQARATVRAHLPELQALAQEMTADAGFDYEVKAELGIVPFPTKVYGGEVYPAGDYEALRITIGRGLGQNWWCVLFPPLCFVDVAAAETPSAAMAAGAVATVDAAEGEGSAKTTASAKIADGQTDGDEADVEYKFFLLEIIIDLVDTVRSWFA